MLSVSDLYLLSDDSSCQALVRKDIFADIRIQTRDELRRLYNYHSSHVDKEIFKSAGIGSQVDKVEKVQSIRGDLHCWLTPSLCKDYGMEATLETVRRIISICSNQLKGHHSLNGEYSAQATLYVRCLHAAAFLVSICSQHISPYRYV